MDSITTELFVDRPSASSSSNHSWTYDVFLSFRGDDTRHNFTDHLHNHLLHKGIKTFIDDELPRGEEISQALLNVIQGSRCSIIVFSKDYAFSKWCLDELAHIIQCRESKKQMVWPVFYKVDPSDVRNQRGSYGEALAYHECKFKGEAVTALDVCKLEDNLKKLQRWKQALTTSASLSGSHYKDGPEYEFIQNIVEEISRSLHNRTPLNVAKYPVGIEFRVRDMEKLLDVGGIGVRMVGIWGTGGIGKTTIAKAVYNSITHEFEGSCFLANVRQESMTHEGLPKLQGLLLCKILRNKEIDVTNVDEGISLIRARLRHKRVLVILDDVSHLNQLDKLAGGLDWFGCGSRVIITTRDKHLLTAHQVAAIYIVPKLDKSQALELFILNAFKQDRSYLDDNVKLKVGTAVDYAQGLPLALTILGSLLCGKSVDKWNDILDSQRRFPNEEIQEVLKISYNALRDPEKGVFLDVACFFKGWEKNSVIQILKGCDDLHPDSAIDVLIEKGLITVDELNNIWMHDLLEDIGKELVRQESPSEAGKRSRLWFHKDVERVLTDNTGTNKIKGIIVKFPEPREMYLTAQSFSEMKNLRIFINCNARFSENIDQFVLPNELVLLDCPDYPLQSFPSNFCPKNLVVLTMPRACISQLWEGFKYLENLAFLNLEFCKSLTKTPDFSGLPNLVRLRLMECTSLVEVDDSIGSLSKLATLNLYGCSKLTLLPTKVNWKSLEYLNFYGCKMLENFPEFREKNESLDAVELSCTGIKELPPSIANLIFLEQLYLDGTDNITTLPRSIYSLQHLKQIFLARCHKLVALPQDKDPGSLALPRLRFLTLSDCSNFSDTNFLETLDCKTALRALRLDGSNIVCLPACIRQFVQLVFLNLSRCKKLQEVPMLPGRVRWVDASGCVALERFENLSHFLEGGESRMIEYIDLEDCKRLHHNLGYMAQMNKILLALSFQRSPFKVILPGGEIPNWFSYRKIYARDVVQECEFSFELPRKSELENSGLTLCAAFRENDQHEYEVDYVMDDDAMEFQASIFINEVSINDMDDRVASALGIQTYFSADNLLLCYVPFRRYMHLGVTSSGYNTCRVQLSLNSYWCFKSCGVHLVRDESISKSEVKDVDAGYAELLADYHFSEADDNRVEEARNHRKRKAEHDDELLFFNS